MERPSYHETDEWREAFSAGFCDGAPAGFDADADFESCAPWQCPWLWDYASAYALSVDGYEAGRRYADEVHDQLAELIAEDEERAREESEA